MVSIVTHRDLQSVQRFTFCYLCGQPISDEDLISRDHVPPKSCFAVRDRKPLVLRTHRRCNGERSVLDKQIGQLIGLLHGKVPEVRDRHLSFAHIGLGQAAVININIPAEVWRWVRGFHAALYHQPMPIPIRGALSLPFPGAPIRNDGGMELDAIKPQHQTFVEVIKTNRAKQNIDSIRCNNGKLTYECIWAEADEGIS